MQYVLAINGGSSSVRFAVFDRGADSRAEPRRRFGGSIERIGVPGTVLNTTDATSGKSENRAIDASDHKAAAATLIDWLRPRLGPADLAGIGHRIVHGGVHLVEHQVVTNAVLDELKRALPLDLAHLPREIALIETFAAGFDAVPQVACFDSAFHRDLPRVARLLPIPRRFDEAGVRRLGFHGLSYANLMKQLREIAGAEAAGGRIILAHLGSGASLAAVRGGRPVDTSMGFTPTSGLVMGTRPGDLDPGLLVYLMRAEKLSLDQMRQFLSQHCGLLGVSQTSPDMRDLMARRATDVRADEAVKLFCYQAKKWIGAYAAALEGLDTLVFAGGIGEHSPQVRLEICQGLEFLGVRIDAQRNAASNPVISTEGGGVTVRVMHTDEEIMIAEAVHGVLATTASKEKQ